ncbi:hypothetical protein N1851_025520 [Merluccius polli]|uniref:RING-type domain-containing protein n=1 Tax=Merluccius polli TaxID=89951 RepID=A0AA47MDB5_MERPO|nr:hypothetical protein N1851_025520 [Merluccius polli]
MELSFVLFKAARRVTLKEEDMSVEKISTIFQVTSQSLYLTGDSNVAVFPGQDGHFSSFDLRDRAHYEVHGVEAAAEVVNFAASGPPPTPSSSSQFRFSRSASSTCTSLPPRAQSLKYFTRTVSLGELNNGKLVNSRMVVVRFTELEASVPSIISKVKDALGSVEPLILTDSNGVEILDSEGTRGSFYWKQNSRKIMAVPEADFQAVQQKRRRISDDDGGLDSVFEKIEEVVLAAQGLSEVTTAIQGLSDLINRNKSTTLVLTEEQTMSVKAAFTCLVCKGFMQDPVFATCCQSLVGCRSCTTLWLQESSLCLKCRADDFSVNIHRVTGLAETVNVISQLAPEE